MKYQYNLFSVVVFSQLLFWKERKRYFLHIIWPWWDLWDAELTKQETSPHLAGCRLSQGDQKFICLFLIPATKGHLSAVPWHWAKAANPFNCALSLPRHLGQSTSTWLNSLTVLGSSFLYKLIQLKSHDCSWLHTSRFSLHSPAVAKNVYFSTVDSKSLEVGNVFVCTPMEKQVIVIHLWGLHCLFLTPCSLNSSSILTKSGIPTPFCHGDLSRWYQATKILWWRTKVTNNPQKRTLLTWGTLLLGSYSVSLMGFQQK